VELVVDQIVVSKLATSLLPDVAVEQILDDIWLANIGYGNNLDVVGFQREVIQMPSDLSKPIMPTRICPFRIWLPPVLKRSD